MAPIRATKMEIHPPRSKSGDPGKDKDSTMHDATKAQDDKPKRKRQSQSTYQLLVVLVVLRVLRGFLLASHRVPFPRGSPSSFSSLTGPLASCFPAVGTDRESYPQAVTRAGPARCDVREKIEMTKPLAASTASALVSHVHTSTNQRSAVLRICQFLPRPLELVVFLIYTKLPPPSPRGGCGCGGCTM